MTDQLLDDAAQNNISEEQAIIRDLYALFERAKKTSSQYHGIHAAKMTDENIASIPYLEIAGIGAANVVFGFAVIDGIMGTYNNLTPEQRLLLAAFL
jgi:hypothetical protein